MNAFQAALAGISTAALTYGALSFAAANIKARARKVGGITFLRIGAYQFSMCRPRPAPAIRAERMALATKRAQSRSAARLNVIASRWANG